MGAAKFFGLEAYELSMAFGLQTRKHYFVFLRPLSIRVAKEMTADNSPSRSLVRADAGALPPALGPELEQAAGYARAEKAEATRRAYTSDFAQFLAWCEAKHLPALPADPGAVPLTQVFPPPGPDRCRMPRLRRCNDRKMRTAHSPALGASGYPYLRPLVGT
jgi:hypothetical protein